MQPIALQIRKDSSAWWSGTGTILRSGEQSYATDTNVLKIGDGVNTWANLPPIGASSTSPLLTDNFLVAGGGKNSVSGTLSYSYDGLTWVASSSTPFSGNQCNSIAWNGSIWLAVGGTASGIIATSSDGINWTAISSNPFISTLAVAWNGSFWVAGGTNTSGGLIATSPDGVTWTSQTSPFNVTGASCSTLAWSGNMWVAGGRTGSSNILSYSYDAITWVAAPIGSSIFGSAGYCKGITWNGLIWVAVGMDGTDGITATSSDGINWTKRTNTAFALGIVSAVAWNGSLWITAGNVSSNGAVASSPDGVTWTDITANLGGTNPFTSCISVAWNGTRWIVGGFKAPNSVAYTSIDTTTWSAVTTSVDQYCRAISSRRVLPFTGLTTVASAGPLLSLSYYLGSNTGANTGGVPSTIGFDTPDNSNTVTGGALHMAYSSSTGTLTNTSNKTISVLISGQVTTDNTVFDLGALSPVLYVLKTAAGGAPNTGNVVSSSVINFSGSSFSTIVVLAPADTVQIQYSQSLHNNPVVNFLGGQFTTRITFTQMEFLQGPPSGSAGGGGSTGPTGPLSGVITTSLIPDTPHVYDLGSTGFPFRSLHVTGSTIYLGNATIKETGGSIFLIDSSGNASSGGSVGPTGPVGTSSSILYGTGAPGTGIGSIGDTYIDNVAGNVYDKITANTNTWTSLTDLSANDWGSIASSANGQRLAAILSMGGGGKVYTNSNYGTGTWKSNTVSGALYLMSIASDSTGQYLIAVDGGTSNSYIYTNSNYGVGSWTQHTSPGSHPWASVTSSSDNKTLTAVSSDSTVAVSIDYGSTWTTYVPSYDVTFADYNGTNYAMAVNNSLMYTRDSTGVTWAQQQGSGIHNWSIVKTISTGGGSPALVIGGISGEALYVSSDGGTTWTASSTSGSHPWTSIAGLNTTIVAVASDNTIIVSTNSGTGFTSVTPPTTSGSAKWVSVSISSSTNWAVAEAGGYIYTTSNSGSSWSPFGTLQKNWTCVVLSDDYDGSTVGVLLACSKGTGGGVYLSNNWGTTFAAVTTGSTVNNFTYVTVSGPNGARGMAAVGTNDYVYISDDAGATWTPNLDFGQKNWVSIMSSGSAATLTLVAAELHKYVWRSGDNSSSWKIWSPPQTWNSVACSADGSRIVAVDSGGNDLNGIGNIWLSSNSGDTWATTANQYLMTWVAVTSSADGQKLAATANTSNVYISTNGGSSWSMIVVPFATNMCGIVYSSDGTQLAAVDKGGYLNITTDSGISWSKETGSGTQLWSPIVSSSDGARLVIGIDTVGGGGAPVYRFVRTTSTAWTKQLNIIGPTGAAAGGGSITSIISTTGIGYQGFGGVAGPYTSFISVTAPTIGVVQLSTIDPLPIVYISGDYYGSSTIPIWDFTTGSTSLIFVLLGVHDTTGSGLGTIGCSSSYVSYNSGVINISSNPSNFTVSGNSYSLRTTSPPGVLYIDASQGFDNGKLLSVRIFIVK